MSIRSTYSSTQEDISTISCWSSARQTLDLEYIQNFIQDVQWTVVNFCQEIVSVKQRQWVFCRSLFFTLQSFPTWTSNLWSMHDFLDIPKEIFLWWTNKHLLLNHYMKEYVREN